MKYKYTSMRITDRMMQIKNELNLPWQNIIELGLRQAQENKKEHGLKEEYVDKYKDHHTVLPTQPTPATATPDAPIIEAVTTDDNDEATDVDPVTNDPVTNDPVTNDPVTNDPVTNDPVTNEVDLFAAPDSNASADPGDLPF